MIQAHAEFGTGNGSMEAIVMKWVLIAFVGSGMPASVGHFGTLDACINAILQVKIPDLGATGRIEEYASLNAKNLTMFCIPVERLMNERAAGAKD